LLASIEIDYSDFKFFAKSNCYVKSFAPSFSDLWYIVSEALRCSVLTRTVYILIGSAGNSNNFPPIGESAYHITGISSIRASNEEVYFVARSLDRIMSHYWFYSILLSAYLLFIQMLSESFSLRPF